MAVTRITHTTRGFDAINYALKGKPHSKDKFVSGRVLISSGVNCTVHGCRTQMNVVWKHFGINRPTRRHRRQIQRLIQSFDPHQLSYKNPADVVKANVIGRNLASKLYPARQSIVVTQADNKRHILHNHIITNMLDFRTGKSMTGKETSWQHVQEISDNVIKDYGLNPAANKRMGYTRDGKPIPKSIHHQTDAEYHIKKRGKYSWVDDISRRVTQAVLNSASMSEFVKRCRDNNVICDPYRKHKGSIRRDKDGNPVLKKHTSFKFTGTDGKEHHIRDRKIGSALNHGGLKSIFSHVATKRQQQQAEAIKRQQAKEDQKKHAEAVQRQRKEAQKKHDAAVKHQRAVEAQRKHERAVKAEQQRHEAERQRKEQIRNERERISKHTNQQFNEMAEDNTRQSEALSHQPEPSFRPIPKSNPKPKDTGRSYPDESQQHPDQSRTNVKGQKRNSRLGVFLSQVRRESHYLKRVYLRAKIFAIKRRITKAVRARIAKVKERIQKRIKAVHNAIIRRNYQRKTDHQAKHQPQKHSNNARKHQEGPNIT